jgi:hypothetical protein
MEQRKAYKLQEDLGWHKGKGTEEPVGSSRLLRSLSSERLGIEKLITKNATIDLSRMTLDAISIINKLLVYASLEYHISYLSWSTLPK